MNEHCPPPNVTTYWYESIALCALTWRLVEALRGVDVLTAQEDGAAEYEDPELLDRSTALNRVLFTQDDDLLREAKRRQQIGKTFAGVVYAHQLNISIGRCIADLELIVQVSEAAEWVNRMEYLPLK